MISNYFSFWRPSTDHSSLGVTNSTTGVNPGVCVLCVVPFLNILLLLCKKDIIDTAPFSLTTEIGNRIALIRLAIQTCKHISGTQSNCHSSFASAQIQWLDWIGEPTQGISVYYCALLITTRRIDVLSKILELTQLLFAIHTFSGKKGD